MPKFTETELAALVDQEQIVGLTLDTTEFFHVGYDYEKPSFKALGQFAGSNTAVIFSEVVLREVQADVGDDIEAKTELIRSGLKQVNKAARLGLDAKALMDGLGLPEPFERAKDLLDAFVAGIGAATIAADAGPSVRALTDLYFTFEPPFSKKAEKKNEFPDAIALLSLECWAKEKGGFVLAVSGDGDWKRFADQSEHVVHIPRLVAALNLFNGDNAVVANRLAANLAAKTAKRLAGRINDTLAGLVETFDVDANAPYFYEVDDEHAVITGWTLANDQFDVIAADDDSVTVAITLAVEATFYAAFTFEVRDSIDRDYVSIGGTRAATEETFQSVVVVTVGRDDDSPDPNILEIEVEGPSISADFGYVEVDYGDDREI